MLEERSTTPLGSVLPVSWLPLSVPSWLKSGHFTTRTDSSRPDISYLTMDLNMCTSTLCLRLLRFHPFHLFTDRNSGSHISMFFDFSITFLTISYPLYLAYVDFL